MWRLPVWGEWNHYPHARGQAFWPFIAPDVLLLRSMQAGLLPGAYHAQYPCCGVIMPNVHYRCTWCHGLKAKADIVIIDDKPICRIGKCKEKYYETSHPRPVPRSVGFIDKGWHCTHSRVRAWQLRSSWSVCLYWPGNLRTRLLLSLSRWQHSLSRFPPRRCSCLYEESETRRYLRNHLVSGYGHRYIALNSCTDRKPPSSDLLTTAQTIRAVSFAIHRETLNRKDL